MKKRVGLLVVYTLLAWAVAAYPARLLGGDDGIVYSAVAVVLCLIPAVLTLLLADRASGQSPDQQVFLLLGGSGIRMGVVLGTGLLLYAFVPYFEQPGFWLWILFFFLFTLTVEIVLVVKGRTAAEPGHEAAAADRIVKRV